MGFKQKYKGVSRIPSGKGFSISLSEADIKSEKSASPEPPKEISYEGQGGKDYENRPEDAINPEGQGGKDYSDYEDIRIVEEERDNSIADASMSRKASPLNDKKSRLEKKGKRLFDKATSSGSFNQEAYDNNEGIKFDNNKAQRQYIRGSKAFEKAKKENKNK